jgi:hypothetical protein
VYLVELQLDHQHPVYQVQHSMNQLLNLYQLDLLQQQDIVLNLLDEHQ